MGDELGEGVPTADEYRRLREATGLSPRSREAAERGVLYALAH